MAIVSEFAFEGFLPFRTSGQKHRFVTGTLEVQDYMFTLCVVRFQGDPSFQVDWLTTPNGLWDRKDGSFTGTVHLARIGADVVLAYVDSNRELVKIRHLIDLIPELRKERSREERAQLSRGAAAFLQVRRRKRPVSVEPSQSNEEPKFRVVAGRDFEANAKSKRVSRKKLRKAASEAAR